MNAPETAVDQATRVAAGATRSRYDNVSIALHWLTVFLVLSLFALGELWGYAHRPLRGELVMVHMSLGILLGLAVAARIVWRLLPGHQVAPAVSGLTETLARIVHWLLYALLAFQSLFGWYVRWSEGEAMSFFGLLIPSPLTPVSREMHHQIQEWHGWVGWAIVIVAAGHAAAALHHHFVLRDSVLVRMLPRGTMEQGAR
ncbi:MAG: cytochrome b [Sphingomonadaceae bacterium]|nr:cytochrome b [Sphingomonadaceae bacterium]